MRRAICRTGLSWPIGVTMKQTFHLAGWHRAMNVRPLERAVNAASGAWGGKRIPDLSIRPTAA